MNKYNIWHISPLVLFHFTLFLFIGAQMCSQSLIAKRLQFKLEASSSSVTAEEGGTQLIAIHDSSEKVQQPWGPLVNNNEENNNRTRQPSQNQEEPLLAGTAMSKSEGKAILREPFSCSLLVNMSFPLLFYRQRNKKHSMF